VCARGNEECLPVVLADVVWRGRKRSYAIPTLLSRVNRRTKKGLEYNINCAVDFNHGCKVLSIKKTVDETHNIICIIEVATLLQVLMRIFKMLKLCCHRI
jgi:hypothetical protein